jgi:hypothetical protein
MISDDTKKASKNIATFVCDLCDFECSKRGDWNRHITRPKHLKHIEMIQNDTNKDIKDIISDHFACECGNIYKHHSGLWRHKKTCKMETKTENDYCKKSDEPTDKDLIMLLIKENSELKNMMMKVLENGTMQNSHNTTTNTNSHNKAFNLQFFLNETCKDAMNITDFV